MDEKLKSELREAGLLPISLDEIAQKEYRKLGIDPTQIELHFSPGTPDNILLRQRLIYSQVEQLTQLEGQETNANYEGIVKQIRDGIDYLKSLRIGGTLHALAIGAIGIDDVPLATYSSHTMGAVTGSYGVTRDPLAHGSRLSDFPGLVGINRDILN